MISIPDIQKYLVEAKLDGWLLADFHARNSVAVEFLDLNSHLTRRFFYFIPASGNPVALVHNIEKLKFTHLIGDAVPFSNYVELEKKLATLLAGKKRVAMEYSPMGRLPYIGLVEAGTIELIRSFGCEIVTSADLVSNFSARLTESQIASHHRAAEKILQIKNAAFALIGERLQSGTKITEWDVVIFIREQFDKHGLITEYGPNCSVNGNAGNPHYDSTADCSSTIAKGSLILLDLWAKETDGTFADITWMAFAGSASEIPKRYIELFAHVANARDAAIDYLTRSFGQKPLYGADADDAARDVMRKAGVADYFTHRTGHSITTAIHGSGPNIDNMETEDRRLLQSGHLFSIEPGLYYDDCGFRSEVDVLITPTGPVVTTLPLQREIVPLLG